MLLLRLLLLQPYLYTTVTTTTPTTPTKTAHTRKTTRYKRLGKSDLVVSQVCLGTMTWGSQNSDQEAFEQCDMAFHEFGVNFIVSEDSSVWFVIYTGGSITLRGDFVSLVYSCGRCGSGSRECFLLLLAAVAVLEVRKTRGKSACKTTLHVHAVFTLRTTGSRDVFIRSRHVGGGVGETTATVCAFLGTIPVTNIRTLRIPFPSFLCFWRRRKMCRHTRCQCIFLSTSKVAHH